MSSVQEKLFKKLKLWIWIIPKAPDTNEVLGKKTYKYQAKEVDETCQEWDMEDGLQ